MMPKRKRAQVSESESINNELQKVKLVKNDDTEDSIQTESPKSTKSPQNTEAKNSIKSYFKTKKPLKENRKENTSEINEDKPEEKLEVNPTKSQKETPETTSKKPTAEETPESTNKENEVPEPSSKTSKKSKNMLRFFSWNVNGARALAKKKEHFAFLQKAAKNPEVQAFGLQETKCDGSTFPKEFEGKKLGFNTHFLNSSATKKGYSGTCVYTCGKKKTGEIKNVVWDWCHKTCSNNFFKKSSC